MLCFTRPDRVEGWARDVMVCSTANVVEMLLTRRPALTDEQRRQVCLDLDASLQAAAGERTPRPRTPRPRAPGPAAGRTAGQARRRTRGRNPAVVLVVGLLMLAAVTTGLLTKAADTFAQVVVGVVQPSPADEAPGKDRKAPAQRDQKQRVD